VIACPRCGTGVAASQEYCLACGLRLPGTGRLGPPPLERRSIALPLLAAGLIAAAGAGAAIAVTWEDTGASRVLVATGGSQPPSAPAQTPQLASWPRGHDGWTIALASIPKTDGREVAVERARQAKARGLTEVGVIDADEVAGLKPGYWVVFTGVYDTEPEATSDLLQARTVTKTAATRHLSG
jgi:hypothetical protein